MKILVVGATGPTGQQILTAALVRHHSVTALVRHPEKASLPTGVRVLQGDVLQPATISAAVAGQDAVLCSLGSPLSRQPTTMLSDGTRNLMDAMQAAAVRRLLCITGVGAGDSKGHGGFLYDTIVQPLILKEIYLDKTRQEVIIRGSSLDWTIIRPGMLTNGPLSDAFQAPTDIEGVTIGKISRASVAAFLLNIVADPATIHHTYNLWTE